MSFFPGGFDCTQEFSFLGKSGVAKSVQDWEDEFLLVTLYSVDCVLGVVVRPMSITNRQNQSWYHSDLIAHTDAAVACIRRLFSGSRLNILRTWHESRADTDTLVKVISLRRWREVTTWNNRYRWLPLDFPSTKVLAVCDLKDKVFLPSFKGNVKIHKEAKKRNIAPMLGAIFWVRVRQGTPKLYLMRIR